MSAHPDSASSEEHIKFPAKAVVELKKFRRTANFCDVQLVVDDKKYLAHKVILAALSPSLKDTLLKMFTRSTAESNPLSINLENVQTCAIEVILNYAYGERFEITKDNVWEIISAANLLQVWVVQTRGFDFLVKNIDLENCVAIYKLAKKYKSEHFIEIAKDFLLRHFRQVCIMRQFLGLDEHELSEIISDDALLVDNEDQVFIAVLRWGLFHEEEPEVLDKILSHVRFGDVNPSLLKERLETVKALQNSKLNFQALVKQARKRRLSFPVEVVGFYLKPVGSSKGMRKVYLSEADIVVTERLVGESERRFLKSAVVAHGESSVAWVGRERTLERFDKDTCSWQELSDDISVKRGCGYTFIGGFWYVMGGLRKGTDTITTDEVFRWNPLTKEKEIISPMCTPVCTPAVVTLNGKIYVFGGFKYGGEQSDYYRYGRGSTGSKRSFGGAFNNDDTPKTPSDTMQRYEVATDTWSEFKLPGPEFRQVVGACALNNCIFCFRRHYPFHYGAKKLKSQVSQQQVFVFNTTGHQWQSCGDLNHIFLSGPVAFKGRIYVVTKIDTWRSGEREKHYLERYSPATNKWHVFAEFPGYTPEAVLGPLKVRCLRDKNLKDEVQLRHLK